MRTNRQSRAISVNDARIGVLDGAGLFLNPELAPVEYDPPKDLAELFTLASHWGLRQIWLTPSALEALGLPAERPKESAGHRFLEHGRLAIPAGQRELGPWLSVWGPIGWTGTSFLEVSIPAWDKGSPFQGLDFAPALLGELLEFTEATGMLWKRSGAITSDAWLRANVQVGTTEYPEIAQDGNIEPDLHWTRAPEGKEGRAQRLYAFDANAMYLGAMSSLALPVGEYLHTVGEPVAPGPGYFHMAPRAWCTRPTLDYRWLNIRELYPEAYTWPESHRFLEPLYRQLRDGRALLLHRPESAALEALKQVYRQGVGRFASTRRTMPDVLYQPYWRHAVMAEARCRLLRRIDSLLEKPVAVDVDCLYFLSSYKGAEKFATYIGLPIDDQIGHFKLAGTMPGKKAREALMCEPSAALRLLREGLTK